MVGNFPVITLCGSTRFKKEFVEAQKRLTLQGNIVISVGIFGHAGDEEVFQGAVVDGVPVVKRMLDDMHKRKIDMADSIYVINVNGYIGESTRSEIRYAVEHGKRIDYLEKPERRICPCCESFYFREKNAYEICPACGWEDDRVQRMDPDFEGGANELSLNEARVVFFEKHPWLKKAGEAAESREEALEEETESETPEMKTNPEAPEMEIKPESPEAEGREEASICIDISRSPEESEKPVESVSKETSCDDVAECISNQKTADCAGRACEEEQTSWEN